MRSSILEQEDLDMTDRPPFNAMICSGIVKGVCVVLEDCAVVYAGPIKGAPDIAGKEILMNAEDFEKLKIHVEKRRH